METALKLLPYVLMALVFVIAWYWDRKYRLPSLEGRVKKLEKKSHIQEVTKEDLIHLIHYDDLYDKNTGQPKYQAIAGCSKMHEAVERTVCAKFDEIKDFVVQKISSINKELSDTHDQLKLMDEKREDTREDLIRVMTQVTTMLQDKKKNEIAEIAKAVAQEIIRNNK